PQPERVLSATAAVWTVRISNFEFRIANCGLSQTGIFRTSHFALRISQFSSDETRAERSISVFAPGQVDVVDHRCGRAGGDHRDVDLMVRRFQRESAMDARDLDC